MECLGPQSSIITCEALRRIATISHWSICQMVGGACENQGSIPIGWNCAQFEYCTISSNPSRALFQCSFNVLFCFGDCIPFGDCIQRRRSDAKSVQSSWLIQHLSQILVVKWRQRWTPICQFANFNSIWQFNLELLDSLDEYHGVVVGRG